MKLNQASITNLYYWLAILTFAGALALWIYAAGAASWLAMWIGNILFLLTLYTAVANGGRNDAGV